MLKPFRYLFYPLYTFYLIKRYTYKREKYEDRDILERIIFKYVLIHLDPKTILDIGREDYEHFYNKFFIGRKMWTIDLDPQKEEFGADNHIIDNVVNLQKHFQNNFFDLIIMNGVFGWGLNEKNEIELALNAVYDTLKPGGLFIFGWNDIKGSVPIPLEEITALKKFKAFHFPPLKGTSFKAINGEHTYNFFIK